MQGSMESRNEEGSGRVGIKQRLVLEIILLYQFLKFFLQV